MIRRPPRSTLDRSSAASDVYKRQVYRGGLSYDRRGPEWRNWQTRRTQNAVSARACGFESRLRHHIESGRSTDRVLEVSGMITATRSPLHTALCERLGIRYPICQAGMAFVARADLAAAVETAAAHGSPALPREEIRRVRTLTD